MTSQVLLSTWPKADCHELAIVWMVWLYDADELHRVAFETLGQLLERGLVGHRERYGKGACS